MKIELVRWDLKAGRMGVHHPQTGLLIDGVFYPLPHRNQLSARDDLRAALELAGVDFDKGDHDALEQQIDATQRELTACRGRFRVMYSGELSAWEHSRADILKAHIKRLEAHLARLEGSRDA